jgi:DNA (cytosine-5)-methyltransferase 1
MEAVRVIKEMRDATKRLRMRGEDDNIRVCPRIAIWENVTGALSSGQPKGADFRCVLEELARIEDPEVSISQPKKWMPSGCVELPHSTITWRTHNAEFWGVPQTRRRISLVVDFRDKPEPEIQFVSDSLSRNFKESKEEQQEVTGTVGEGVDSAISFQERAGKPGGAKESSFRETGLEQCQPQTIKPLCIGGDKYTMQ